MSRQTKPYYRSFTKSWYTKIDGKQFLLGKTKTEANKKFKELMDNRDNLAAEINLAICNLDWYKVNRLEGTYDNQRRCLKSFFDSAGRAIKIAAVTKQVVLKWSDSLDCTSTSKNNAISTVQRLFNRGIENGYIARSPIPKIKKPKNMRSDVFISFTLRNNGNRYVRTLMT